MRRDHAIGNHAGDITAVACDILDHGAGNMLQHRVRRQKEGFHVGEFAVDERHAQLRLIIAVLPQAFDDDSGADCFAIIGDQPVSGCDDHVVARPAERLSDDINPGVFGKHRCFRGVDRDNDVYLREEARAAADNVKMPGGHRVERARAYCDSHTISVPRCCHRIFGVAMMVETQLQQYGNELRFRRKVITDERQ